MYLLYVRYKITLWSITIFTLVTLTLGSFMYWLYVTYMNILLNSCIFTLMTKKWFKTVLKHLAMVLLYWPNPKDSKKVQFEAPKIMVVEIWLLSIFRTKIGPNPDLVRIRTKFLFFRPFNVTASYQYQNWVPTLNKNP